MPETASDYRVFGVKAPDGSVTRVRVPANLSRVEVEKALKSFAEQFPVPAAEKVDVATGAPPGVRALVGGASSPEDRLATLQGFYPGAERDIVRPENFVFRNPTTGKPTLYNPQGFDVGDVASVAREGAQAVGGTIGAIGGAAAGGPAGGIAGAGGGTLAGGEIFDAIARRYGMKDTRTPAQHAAGAAIETGLGAGGQAIGVVGGAALRAGARRMFRGAAGQAETQRVLQAFEGIGATPTVGQATAPRWVDALEGILSRMPGGSGPLARRAQDTIAKFQAAVKSRVSTMTSSRPVEPEVAGRVLIRSIDDFTVRFKAKAGDLFDGLDKYIPAGTPISVYNTATALNDLTKISPAAPNVTGALVNPTLKKLNDALGADVAAIIEAGGGGLPYEVLKNLRSMVGRKLATPSLVADVPTAEMKMLYAALSNDMRIAAQAAGPEAIEQFTRANTFYGAGMKRIEDFLQPLVDRGVPEQVFLAVERGGKEGATMLRAVRRSLKPEEWRIVAATALQRLGRATASQQDEAGQAFSVETYLTNWNRLSDNAKDALFAGDTGLQMLRGDLNQLALVAERVRANARVFANPSGTAGNVVGQTLGLVGVGSVMLGDFNLAAMLAAGGVSAHLTARLMTNRNFVHWLARSTKLESGGVGAHLGRLGAIAANERDPETRDAMVSYLKVFTEMPTTRQVQP